MGGMSPLPFVEIGLLEAEALLCLGRQGPVASPEEAHPLSRWAAPPQHPGQLCTHPEWFSAVAAH